MGRLELRQQRRTELGVGTGGVGLFGPHHQEGKVLCLCPGLRHVREVGQGDLRQELLVQLPLGRDAGDRRSDEEVVGVVVGQVRRGRLVPLLVLALDRAEQVALLALQFSIREAVLVDALNLLEHGRQAGPDAVRLDP